MHDVMSCDGIMAVLHSLDGIRVGPRSWSSCFVV